MKSNYADILSLTDKKPLWYDESGCPRYEKFTPNLCPNIYADEVILLEIACQDCGKRFKVQMSAWVIYGGYSFRERLFEWKKDGKKTFTPIHYGDPPIHGCVGDTMNCEDLKVLEFWEKDRVKFVGFKRRKDLEVNLEEEK